MKVAIIGAGFGQYAVAPVFRKLGFEAVFVTPRDPEEVERLLASDADLISIHSPPFMHYDHVMKALDHGHAVLCDKPFGLNAGQARAMRDREKEMGVLHFANLEMRNKPVRAQILELVHGGARVRTGTADVELLAPPSLGARYPGLPIDTGHDRLVGLAIRVAGLGKARAALTQGNVPWREIQGRTVVGPADACGALLEFVA